MCVYIIDFVCLKCLDLVDDSLMVCIVCVWCDNGSILSDEDVVGIIN